MGSSLKGLKLNHPKKRTSPLWAGPCGEGANGGVTQSLLSRYLACPERFRILVVEGLKAADSFSPALEYGNMWHVCEEHFAFGKGRVWANHLTTYCKELCKKYPLQQEQVNHWYQLCLEQFPLYIEHWQHHPDVQQRTPLMQEQEFDVPYTLPSGRVVRMRGKWDSVDLIGKGKEAGVYIQENKTKSQVDEGKLRRQLRRDLQSMFYVIAYGTWQQLDDYGVPIRFPEAVNALIRGVRYNVIRRSAHKSVESMVKKIEEDRGNGRVGEWFAWWKVEISQRDVERFKVECLHPILENLCDDYEWWADVCTNGKTDGYDVWSHDTRADAFNHKRRQFLFPYGVYAPVAEGGFGETDEYIETGSTVGLQRCENLFPELGGGK